MAWIWPRWTEEKPSPPVSTGPVMYSEETAKKPYQAIRSKISIVLATQKAAG